MLKFLRLWNRVDYTRIDWIQLTLTTAAVGDIFINGMSLIDEEMGIGASHCYLLYGGRDRHKISIDGI